MKRIIALMTVLLMLSGITVVAFGAMPGSNAKKETKAKKEKTDPVIQTVRVYMFGLSASFNDTIVYLTDVQTVDSVYFNGKKFLGGYREYSDQMAAYFQETTGDRRTNAIFFKRKRSDIEKQYVKIRRKYEKDGMTVKPMPAGEFRFTAIKPE